MEIFFPQEFIYMLSNLYYQVYHLWKDGNQTHGPSFPASFLEDIFMDRTYESSYLPAYTEITFN